MKQFPSLIIFWLLFSLTQAIHGKDHFLAQITSGLGPKSYNLIVETDDQNRIIAIKTRRRPGDKVKVYPAAILENPVPLAKSVGIVLVDLTCKPFDPQKGCPIEIRYPYNITVAAFKRFQAKLAFTKGKWQITANDKAFTKMHLVARKFIGILIGVKKIELH